jgi:hypothetical protein
MGLLSPLFLIGLLGISLPILFHLIRRTPKGQLLFSTLMFLEPSPPQITRRSRLENLLLLLLRACILALLALAFSRPFMREATKLGESKSFSRRVAIVVDGSASMQQPGVWTKVRETVEKVVSELKPGDHPALFIFDERLKTLHGFGDVKEFDLDGQKQSVLDAMQSAVPSWRSTDIGEALVQAADILASSTEKDGTQNDKQIVFISDLQRGASLDSLQATTFPDDVRVDVRTITYRPGGNASIEVLGETELQTFYRVRIVNGEDSVKEQFSLSWLDESLQPVEIAKAGIYVAPGQNRVVQIEKPADAGLVCLQLDGEASGLGTRYFVLNSPPAAVAVTYIGETTEEVSKPLYYLRRTMTDTSSLKIDLAHPKSPAELTDRLNAVGSHGLIVIVGGELGPEFRTNGVWDLIAAATVAGSHLLWVVHESDEAALQRVLGNPWQVESFKFAKADGYAMWTDVNFEHPLFAPFANPRYSDFTNIRFWKWRKISFPADVDAQILAKFDPGASEGVDASPEGDSDTAPEGEANSDTSWDRAAVIHTRLGSGDVYLLASGWSPDESQLALSTKFLPIVHSAMPGMGGQNDSSMRFHVGDSIRPAETQLAGLSMTQPNGESLPLEADSFDETEKPGVYTLVDGKKNSLARYAVNLDSRETDTRVRDAVDLEQYGVSLGAQPTQEERLEEQRQLRDRQLEQRQQLWRWGIALALLIVLAETIVAGRTARASLDAIASET